MKVLIEIDEKTFKALHEFVVINTGRSNGKTIIDKCLKAISNGTPIPDNATNGDVIKAMFPTADISLNDSCFEGVVNKYGFDMKWWNAPYKAESENDE